MGPCLQGGLGNGWLGRVYGKYELVDGELLEDRKDTGNFFLLGYRVAGGTTYAIIFSSPIQLAMP